MDGVGTAIGAVLVAACVGAILWGRYKMATDADYRREVGGRMVKRIGFGVAGITVAYLLSQC